MGCFMSRSRRGVLNSRKLQLHLQKSRSSSVPLQRVAVEDPEDHPFLRSCQQLMGKGETLSSDNIY